MKSRSRIRTCGLPPLAAVVATCLALPATAQRSAPVLEEVMVTAQRRSESVLSVPMSIATASGEQLNNSGIAEMTSLQYTVPGLIPNDGSGYTQVFIRGIGNTIFVGADPSVATFIDDVPRIYGSLVNNLVNVERVEILKGAQGGLYGRNATGGVINIVTRQPGDEPAGELRAAYASKNTRRFAGYLNVPIADHVAWNISAQRETHDGYVDNLLKSGTPYSAEMFPVGSFLGTPQQTADFFNSAVNPPSDLGERDFWSADTKLRLDIGERVTLTLAGNYSHKDDDDGNEQAQVLPQYAVPFTEGFFRSMGIEADLPDDFFKAPHKDFAAYRSARTDASLKDYGASLTAEIRLARFNFTSITAWREQETHYYDEQAGLGPSIVTADITYEKDYLYQELRALSTGEGPWQWLAGASYLDTNVEGETVITYLPPLFTAAPTASEGGVKNWSVYFELGYDLTSRWNLKVSGRYIKEENEVEFSSPLAGKSDVSADDFLPAATLSYGLESGGTLYARYARGFKAGGVNTVDPPTVFPGNFGKIFDPEEVDTWEIGYRDSFLGGALQLTTAAFYNDYQGLQFATTGNPQNANIIFAIVNAGSAETYGAEATLSWQALAPLTLNLNVGYLKAEYEEFANTDGSVLNTFDFSGETMVFSPEWQVSLSADLNQPLGNGLDLIGNLLAAWTDDTKLQLATVPGITDPVNPDYWLVNARLGLRTSDGRYEVALYGTNLLDEGYYALGNSSAFGKIFDWGDPRIIGVEFGFRF